MNLVNTFEVPAPVEVVWNYLLDVEKVVPCMPGAEVTESVDESTWKGKVTVKVGPVSMSFAGTVTMQERDDAAHRVVLYGKGVEQRGKGAASATVTTTLEGGDGVTTVNVVQDLKVQGQAAQFGRGMLQDISAKLTQQFADCLQRNIVAAPGEEPSEAAAAEPVRGLRLGLSALLAAAGRWLRRLFRSSRQP